MFKTRRYDGIDLNETRVFDYYAYNGGPISVLLPVRNGRLEDGVLIFNERNLFRTSLTYETYLKALTLTRGLLFWQYLLCIDAKVERYEVGALERGLKFLEQIFPNDEYADLRSRLGRLKKGT